jgi:hypothetical protein
MASNNYATNYTGKKGSASIIRMGHTSLGRYGDDPNVPTRNSNPREEKP